jgi:signal transduction histidine kinase
MSLFRRMFLGHFVVLLVAVLLLSFLLTFVVENTLYRQKRADLLELAVPIAREFDREGTNDLRFVSRLNRLLNESRIHLVVLDEQLRPVYASDRIAGRIRLPEDVVKEIREGKRVEGMRRLLKRPVTWVAVPRGKNGEKGAVLLYSPVEGTVRAIRQTRLALLLAALVSLLVSLAISGWFSGKLARRISRLRIGTRRIQEGDLSARIPEEGKANDEIALLAHDFNSMAKELERTHRELQLFEENRRQFILDLSHELRTPLTSIRGWLEALRKDFVPDGEKPRIYANMERELLRLIRLIQELMDLEKIRAGKVELKKGVYPVRDLFELVADQLMWMAEEKGLSIRIDLPEPEKPLVYGDYDRLLQILVNLVKNGIQFTEQGSITLSASQTEQETVIRVRDTGIGMTPEELERIWDRFFKADPSRARRGGETGLGLAIVKQLAEAHGGRITAESEPGKGTCFTLVLPFSPERHNDVHLLS